MTTNVQHSPLRGPQYIRSALNSPPPTFSFRTEPTRRLLDRLAVYSNISGFVEGDERQARMPSQSPHAASSNISGLSGGDERHAKSPLAPNCKTPERLPELSVYPHAPPSATGMKVPGPMDLKDLQEVPRS